MTNLSDDELKDLADAVYPSEDAPDLVYKLARELLDRRQKDVIRERISEMNIKETMKLQERLAAAERVVFDLQARLPVQHPHASRPIYESSWVIMVEKDDDLLRSLEAYDKVNNG